MSKQSKLSLCVFIPCHNEAANLTSLIKKFPHSQLPPHKIIIINDNSTDNTGAIADRLAKKNKYVTVLHRLPPNGRGRAGVTGWLECLRYKPDFIMEMDADHSHDPQQIPQFLAAQKATDADVVIGSRYISGGREVRGWHRKLLSFGAEKYLKLLFSLPHLTDPSAGFRLFTRQAVQAFDPKSLTMPDHRITTQILFRVRNMRIVEVPIIFHDRKHGHTKLRWQVVLKSLISPLLWRLSA